METIKRTTAFMTPRPAGAAPRTVRGVVMHHTGGSTLVRPSASGSWHLIVDRDGTVYEDVAVFERGAAAHIAWHTRATDRWRPDWVGGSPSWANCSDINACTVGIELVSAAGITEITRAQAASMQAVASWLTDLFGDGLRWIGHGEVQTDRRLTEPDNFGWEQFSVFDRADGGRRWHRHEEDNMTDGEKMVIDTLRKTQYPATEAASVLEVFAGINANRASVDLWVSEIGALTAQNAALMEEIAALKAKAHDATA